MSRVTSKRSRTTISRPQEVNGETSTLAAAPMTARQQARLSPSVRPRPAPRTRHFDPDPYDINHDVDMDPPDRPTQPATDIDLEVDTVPPWVLTTDSPIGHMGPDLGLDIDMTDISLD